jgi:DivIVA domain-containing protein
VTQALLVLAVALTVGLIVFGITVLITGDDEGLRPAEPDGRAVPLPADRPLVEADLERVRFDTVPRGYRMAQVDAALRRAAYDVGYKDELARVLQAEVDALREGRFPDAEVLRRAREAAMVPVVSATAEVSAAAEVSAEGAEVVQDATVLLPPESAAEPAVGVEPEVEPPVGVEPEVEPPAEPEPTAGSATAPATDDAPLPGRR